MAQEMWNRVIAHRGEEAEVGEGEGEEHLELRGRVELQGPGMRQGHQTYLAGVVVAAAGAGAEEDATQYAPNHSIQPMW